MISKLFLLISIPLLLVSACVPIVAAPAATPTAGLVAHVSEGVEDASTITSVETKAATPGNFTLTSPEVAEGGTLPAEYTCDGAASTLALSWSGAPAGTHSYAVIMHHVAGPTDIHWYLVLYNLPASVTSLPKNFTGIGMLGNNSVNGRTEYAPPCSKGPGPKMYTYTVYALSAKPQLSVPPAGVNRQVLLDAIQGITLASADLHVTYTRP
jgi:phosphatidylethanolamine-binding protein (PEBP) family uncharacterized protein